MPYNPVFGNYPVPALSDTPEPIELGNLITDGWRGEELNYNKENHIVIFGKAGSGKDTRLLIPNLLHLRDRSIVAVDPKGEMAAVTAPVRKKYGRVVILNPFGVLCDLEGYSYMEGCGFNPLCSLSPFSPDFNKDAGLLAEALVPMTGNEKEPFFPLMARSMVSFLIMAECVKAKAQGRDPYLFNVRRMLCEETAEGAPPSKAMPYGIPATGIPAYAREMLNSSIAGLRNKAGQFVKWHKEMNSVASTARAETEFLDDPQMAYALAQNDFDFREVKERPTSVYLVLPMEVMKRHGKWLRMVLTIALNACQRQRVPHEPRSVFIFNEFAALGHLQLIEDNFTVVRGAGIQMIPVLQDINQLQQLYDKRWQTFLANTDAIVTFAPNDNESAAWFSKRAGETGKLKISTTENWSQNSGNTQNQGQTGNGETSGSGTSGGWSVSRTENYSYEKEPAVTTYELFNMQPGEMRIIAANRGDTFHAHALPYYRRRKLIEETGMPENPYNPKAKTTRIARQVPDYEGFMHRMLATLPTTGENHNVDSNDGSDWGEPALPKPSSPAGNDYVDNATWSVPQGDSRWEAFGDDAPQGNGGVFSALFGSSPPVAPSGELNQPPPVSRWLDDSEETDVEQYVNAALQEFADGKSAGEFMVSWGVVGVARLDLPSEATRDAENHRQHDVDLLYKARLGRRATREEKNHNQFIDGELVAVTLDGRAHRLNPAFVDLKLLATANEHENKRIPAYSEVVLAGNAALEEWELGKVRLLPSPSASPAPVSGNQEPIGVSPTVQAQHPGYVAKPPKRGGDDWAYDDDAF